MLVRLRTSEQRPPDEVGGTASLRSSRVKELVMLFFSEEDPQTVNTCEQLQKNLTSFKHKGLD